MVSVIVNSKTVMSRTNFVVLIDSNSSDSTNASTNVWIQKSDLPVNLKPGMGLVHLPGIAVGNKGYIYLNPDLWAYDPTTDYGSKKASQPIGSYAFAFSIHNKIYFGSNCREVPDSVALWAYDVATDS